MDPANPQLIYSDSGIDPETINATLMTTVPIRGNGGMTSLESSPIASDSQDSEVSPEPPQVHDMADGAMSPQILQPRIIQIPAQRMDDDEHGLSFENSEVVSGPSAIDMGHISTVACLICQDRGTGYHYSVLSCEGCKGFFKRTVQKGLIYACKHQAQGFGMCTINKITRNSCQYCRYQKCLQIGMKREAVREDRSPGGKQHLKRAHVDEDHVVLQACGPEQKQMDDEHKAMIQQLVDANPDKIPNPSGISKPLSELTIEEVMQFGYMELKYIIEWAKKVPGFRELCIEDKMALLKSSFMELNTFRLAYRSVGFHDMVRFAEGVLLPKTVAESMGWGTELISSTLEFAERLRELSVDKTEFCILNAIVLTYPDAIGLLEKAKVTELQTRLLDILRRYIFSKQSMDVGRFGKILLRLPTLRTVSAKAAERFLSLSLEGVMPLNDLVQEMMS